MPFTTYLIHFPLGAAMGLGIAHLVDGIVSETHGTPRARSWRWFSPTCGLLWFTVAALGGTPFPSALRIGLLLSILLGIALADLRSRMIPDTLSIGGALTGVALSAIMGTPDLRSSLLGMLGAFVFLFGLAWVASTLLKRDAMGGGDIKTFAMLGAFLGFPGAFLSLFLASLAATLLAWPLSWRRGHEIPFGIFLAIGGAVSLLFGEQILMWYIGALAGPVDLQITPEILLSP